MITFILTLSLASPSHKCIHGPHSQPDSSPASSHGVSHPCTRRTQSNHYHFIWWVSLHPFPPSLHIQSRPFHHSTLPFRQAIPASMTPPPSILVCISISPFPMAFHLIFPLHTPLDVFPISIWSFPPTASSKTPPWMHPCLLWSGVFPSWIAGSLLCRWGSRIEWIRWVASVGGNRAAG